MAYVSPAQIEAMKDAGVPTGLREGKLLIPLSPNQMALLLGLYNMVKGDNNEESPWDVAYAKFRELYHVDEGLWVKTELPEGSLPVDANAKPPVASAMKLAGARQYRTKPKILFAPGTYRAEDGRWVKKSAADVEEMLRNFRELAARGEFPSVTKGHPPGSSAPKFGELGDVWMDPSGNQIIGPLVKLHEEFADSIEAGEFDKVSIVFSDHWWDPTSERFRDNVITEVGVLGAKWPAFKDQPDALEIDHTALAEGGGDGVVRYRLSMADVETTKAPDEGGGEDVEDKERKELLTKIEALETKVAELEAAQPDEEKDALEAKVADLTAKLELATKAGEAAAEKIADAEVKAKSDKVDEVLKEAVTADAEGQVRMTPAEAEVQKPVLMSMDDSRTIKLAEGEDGGEPVMASPFEQACEAIRTRPVVLKLSEQSVEGGDDLHPGTDKDELKPETAQEKETREGMGYERQEDGSWASPKDKE